MSVWFDTKYLDGNLNVIGRIEPPLHLQSVNGLPLPWSIGIDLKDSEGFHVASIQPSGKDLVDSSDDAGKPWYVGFAVSVPIKPEDWLRATVYDASWSAGARTIAEEWAAKNPTDSAKRKLANAGLHR